MEKDAAYYISKLDLKPHPEGGYFKETYRSEGSIQQSALPEEFGGDRSFATAIYFLMEGGNFSAFHRIASDEVWHFYAGRGITVFVIQEDGVLEEIKLGNDPDKGEVFQAMVPAGTWFASRPTEKEGWALVGCTVSPGFDFEDFEMAKRETLTSTYPQHQRIIKQLTRE